MGVDRWKMMAWLKRQGFVALPRNKTGHAHFTHPQTGVKVTVTAHGRGELTKNEELSILRTLERCGYRRTEVREEIRK